MSRIDDLIAKYCPNGVDYLCISDLGEFVSGLKGKTKEDFESGNAKYVSYKNVFENIEVDFSNLESVKINDGERQTKLQRGDLIFTSSSENLDESGMTSVVTETLNEDIFLNSFCFFVHLPESIQPEFAKYLFRSTDMRKKIIKCANGVTRYNISKKALSKIKFPVPPLEVQDEIARILDSFTKLEAELEAELEARRKQYEYYRASLFDSVRLCAASTELTLGELGTWSGGGTPSKSVSSYWTEGYLWVSPKDMKQTVIFQTEDQVSEEAVKSRGLRVYPSESILLVARSGILKHSLPVGILEKQATVNQDIKALRVNSNVMPKYSLYALQNYSQDILRKCHKAGGSVDSLDVKKLLAFQIPVPPLAEQERIVAILDKFDALVNDLSSGLPAEIAARRKQYEYYRDRLLTFTPAK